MTAPPPLTDRGRDVVVGLVNNMQDAALRTTERQFRELVSAASGDIPVHLKFYTLTKPAQTDANASLGAVQYDDIGELWSSRLDGLIVTGREPRTPILSDEPYWPTLAKLIDWAEDHTISTVWSCLAAHAAVLHIDGVARRPWARKLSGVYECAKAAEHPLTARVPAKWRVPQSRYNDLPEEALISHGYQILSRSDEAGVDTFVKQRKSFFLFFQGHPEYDPAALLREYRRDIGAFLGGTSEHYPDMPSGCFDQETAASLSAFRRRALDTRDVKLLSSFPMAEASAKVDFSWREPATRIYANWLSFLAERKYGRSTSELPQASDRARGNLKDAV